MNSIERLIQKCFTPSLALIACLVATAAVRADAVYVTDTSQGLVHKYSMTGEAQGSFGPPGTGGLTGTFQPMGIALDPTGNILVADSYSNNIVTFSASNGFSGVFAHIAGNYMLNGLVVDGNGTVYVATVLNGVIKFSADGSTSTALDSGVTWDAAVAIDRTNAVYVGNAAGNWIHCYSTTGKALQFFGDAATGTANLDAPEGLAFDSAGNLYVANYHNSTIVKFSANGQTRSLFITNALDGPQGMAFDSSGNLYVVNNGNYNIQGKHPLAGTVQKFGPDGTYLGLFANTGGAAHYIAIQSTGNVTASAPRIAVTAATHSGQGSTASFTLTLDSSATGFTLETSTLLSSATAGWSSVTNIAGATTLPIGATNAAGFFRLRK